MVSPMSRLLRVYRLALLAMPVAISACGSQARLEDARKAVIVDAEGAQLTGAMLEQYLLRIPESPTRVTADMLVSAWIDIALLQHATRTSADLTDSALTDQALRPDAVRGLLQEFALRRLAASRDPSDAEADSVFQFGAARVFQQIRIAMDPRDTSPENKARARFANDLRARAQTGESFTALVREHSQDSIYKSVDGYLPAAERTDLPTQVANRIWALNPNEISEVVFSPVGAHIFRRATAIEARPNLKAWLKPRLAEQANIRYVDSMSRAHRVRVAPDAVERMRTLAPDPMKNAGGDGPLVTWDTDSLRADQVRLWLAVMPPRERVQFAGAADTSIGNWLLQIGKWEMIVRVIAPGGVPTPEARTALVPQYREAAQRILAAWNILGAGKQPTAAASAVLDTLASGKLPYRPPPGALSGLLRARSNVVVRPEFIDVIVEESALERSRRIASDSAAPRTPAPSDSARP